VSNSVPSICLRRIDGAFASTIRELEEMMDDSQTIPFANQQRVKTLRLGHGLRAVDVAQETGLSVAQVYRLEAGERPNVAAVTLARVALALDTSVEYLLNMTDDTRSVHQLLTQCTAVHNAQHVEGTEDEDA
jgi:transcriptional regulator with XRE-family HTH domain